MVRGKRKAICCQSAGNDRNVKPAYWIINQPQRPQRTDTLMSVSPEPRSKLIWMIKNQSIHAPDGHPLFKLCHCESRSSHWGDNSTQNCMRVYKWVCMCVCGVGGGRQGHRESHTPAEGGIIPKVTRITSLELCPDTPISLPLSRSLFSFSLSLCLSLSPLFLQVCFSSL